MEASKVAPAYKAMIDNSDTLSCEQKALPVTVQFSDYQLPEFMRVVAAFGSETYAYVVTPNVDHLIRYCDDASFRELYRAAGFVLLDSRFLAYVLQLTSGLHLPTCPGSDVTEQLFDE